MVSAIKLSLPVFVDVVDAINIPKKFLPTSVARLGHRPTLLTTESSHENVDLAEALPSLKAKKFPNQEFFSMPAEIRHLTTSSAVRLNSKNPAARREGHCSYAVSLDVAMVVDLAAA
jgi:hypothetical protein